MSAVTSVGALNATVGIAVLPPEEKEAAYCEQSTASPRALSSSTRSSGFPGRFSTGRTALRELSR